MANDKRPWSPTQIIWSALVTIVLWSALGFGWFGFGFGWVTPGGASHASSAAVTNELATICVAQAKSSPDSSTALAKLSDLTSWKQTEFVEKAGWSTMHGSESSSGGVAERCATKLRVEHEQRST